MNPTPDPAALRSALSRLLTAGTLLAAAVILAGFVVSLFQSPPHADLSVFSGEPAGLNSLSSVLRAVAALDGRALMQLGVLTLIATPVARVVASTILFAIERDRLYTILSLVVLAGLALGLLGWVE